jgi:AraC-like DNA-binding protein/predicted N-acetyltransferase YhbS
MTEKQSVSPPIQHVLAFMEAHFDEPLSLAQLAAMCNRSLYRFATVFRQEVGIPPHQYLCYLRIRQAQSLLRRGAPLTDAALETGFFDQSHLTRHFKRLCGVTPGQFGLRLRNGVAEGGDGMALEGMSLRSLQESDLEAAHRLSVAALWPHRLEDWRMFRDLGRGIVACDGSGAIVGTALSWRFGDKAATLGMVLVALALQGRGMGHMLMDNVLEDLEGRALMLNATEAGQRLYKALGFSTVGTFRQHQGTYQPTEWKARKTRARKLLPADRDAVAALDTAAFGAPRTKLLDRLLAEGDAVVIEGANGVAGFAIRRDFGRGRVIGPVIAADEAAAIDLIAALAEPGFLRIDIPSDAPRLSAWLGERGLMPVGIATMMVRGAWVPAPPHARRFGLVSQAFG